MWLTKTIQLLSALLAVFGMFNWLVIMLSERIQHLIPVRLIPVTSYMDAVVVFGIGAGVYCLATQTLGARAKASH